MFLINGIFFNFHSTMEKRKKKKKKNKGESNLSLIITPFS